MNLFRVDCSCGRYLSVGEGAAGAKLQCECGRTVNVPGLNALLAQAELPLHRPSPELVIGHMIAAGELPGRDTCVVCGGVTTDVAWILAECERVYVSRSGLPVWFQVLLQVLFSPFGFIVWQRQETYVHGSDTILQVPLRVCGKCQQRLRSQQMIKRYLQETPVYAELLEKFPETKLQIIKC